MTSCSERPRPASELQPVHCSSCSAQVTCSCTTLTCLTLYCSTAGLIQVNSLQPLSTRLCTQSYAPRHTPIKQNRYLLDPVQRRQSTAPSCTAGIWESSHQPSQVFIVRSAQRPGDKRVRNCSIPAAAAGGVGGHCSVPSPYTPCSCTRDAAVLHTLVSGDAGLI